MAPGFGCLGDSVLESHSGIGFRYGAKAISLLCHISGVAWEVEFTDGNSTGKGGSRIRLPSEHGPNLGFLFSSNIATSRFPEMRELRTQAHRDPLRTLYAFHPRRVAILLLAGDKTGDDRWYEKKVPIADRLFEDHLNLIKKKKASPG